MALTLACNQVTELRAASLALTEGLSDVHTMHWQSAVVSGGGHERCPVGVRRSL